MFPEGVVNVCRGLLGVAGHGFDKHLQRALQQNVDAAIVIIVVATQVQRQTKRVRRRRRFHAASDCGARETDRIPYRQWM